MGLHAAPQRDRTGKEDGMGLCQAAAEAGGGQACQLVKHTNANSFRRTED